MIGTGAFATVYRAVDERLDAAVAVKVLADNHSIDADVRDRFVQEGRLLRRAHSRHLVVVHDIGETERAQPFLVLEWADRGDLASRLADLRARGGAATPADGLVLARALAAALGALHATQVVHRDLTPRNLLLRSEPGSGSRVTPAAATTSSTVEAPVRTCAFGADEQVVVTDLGLSKDLARASGLTLATGTSGFAAPEQRDAGALVDPRADVWAASALLVWLATGDAPDDGGRWRERVVDVSWPAEVVALLERGLHPSPEARPPAIEAWLDGLESVLGPGAAARRHPGSSAGPPGQDAAAAGAGHRGPFVRRSRQGEATGTGRLRRWVAVGAAVATLLAGAVTGYLVGKGDDGGPTVTTETLAGGRERSVTEGHGITITLVGPTEVAVGEPAGLSATVDGAASWAWLAPDGSMHREARRLDVVPAGPGRLTVRLVATDEDGRPVQAEHRVQVVEG